MEFKLPVFSSLTISKFRWEYLLQLSLWTVYFATINVNWTGEWFAPYIFPENIPPHLAILFPLIFLANAYFFVPRYFNRQKWYLYILYWIILLTAVEIVRTLLFFIFMDEAHQQSFLSELVSNNSLIFGRLNFITYNLLFWSLFYRFLLDRFTERVPTEENIPTPANEAPAAVLPLSTQHNVPTETLIFKKGKEEVILEVKEVVYFQAQGDFVLAIDTKGKKYVINKSLREIKHEIDEQMFYQINRSEIVNRLFVQKFSTHIKNRLQIELSNAEVVYSSNSRTPGFRKWIK